MIGLLALYSLLAQSPEMNENLENGQQPVPPISAFELHIPKAPDESTEQVYSFLQNLITAVLLETHDSLQREYSTQLQALTSKVERQRTIRYPFLSKWVDENRDLVLAKVEDKKAGERLLRELRSLELVVDITFEIDLGIESTKTSFPIEKFERSDELLRIYSEARLKPRLAIKRLALGLENPIVGDAVDVPTQQLFAGDGGAVLLETSAILINADVRVYEVLAARSNQLAPIVQIPLVGLKTNLSSVFVERERAKEIVQNVLSKKQVQDFLAAISQLNSLKHLLKFGEAEVKGRLQNLELDLLFIVSLKRDLVGPPSPNLSGQFDFQAMVASEAANQRLAELTATNSLVFAGDIHLPVKARDFRGELDLEGLKVFAEMIPAKVSRLDLVPRFMSIPKDLVSFLPAGELPKILEPLIGNNLISQDIIRQNLAVSLEVGFSDEKNSLLLPMKWDLDDLQWDTEKFEINLPFLDNLKFGKLDLKSKDEGKSLSLDFSRSDLDIQVLNATPAILSLLQSILGKDFEVHLERYAASFVRQYVEGIQNLAVGDEKQNLKVSIKSFALAENAIDLIMEQSGPGSRDSNEVYRLGFSVTLPDEIEVRLDDVVAAPADINAIDLRLINKSSRPQQVSLILRGYLETREIDGRLEYRVRHLVEEFRFERALHNMIVGPAGSDVVLDTIVPHGFKGWMSRRIDNLGSIVQYTPNNFYSGLSLRAWIAGKVYTGAQDGLRSGLEDAKGEIAKTARQKLQEVLDSSKVDFIQAYLKKSTDSLQQDLQISWRWTAEKAIRDLFLANANGKTDDPKAASKLFFPSNPKLKELRASAESFFEKWVVEAISGNAKDLEVAAANLFESQVQPMIENMATQKSQTTESLGIGGDAPARSLSPEVRSKILADGRMKALIYLFTFNDFLEQNLEWIESQIEAKAKENFFINRTFSLELTPPISTQGRFFIINQDGNLELRMGVNLEQDSIAVQTATSWIGLILDGPLSAISGEKIDLFQNIFSLPGRVVDAAGSVLTDLDTRGDAELRAVVNLSLSTPESKYSLGVKIRKIELLHVDPVTLVTKVAADFVLPKVLDDFDYKMEFSPPELPVIKNLITFKLEGGSSSITADQDRQVLELAITPVYHFDPAVRPELVYEAAQIDPEQMPTEIPEIHSEAPAPQTAQSNFVIPKFNLFSFQSPESSAYFSVYGFIESQSKESILSSFEEARISPAAFISKFYQHPVSLSAGSAQAFAAQYSDIDLEIIRPADFDILQFQDALKAGDRVLVRNQDVVLAMAIYLSADYWIVGKGKIESSETFLRRFGDDWQRKRLSIEMLRSKP